MVIYYLQGDRGKRAETQRRKLARMAPGAPPVQGQVGRFLLCLWFASAVWASQAGQPKGKEPIAVVGGQAIYDEDLLPLIQSQMRQVRQQEYELKSKALESLIQQKLLEAQASKRGLSASALLEQEADAKVGEPSESEIQAFYMAQKDRINRPLEEVKVQLLQALKQAKL